MDTDQEIKRVKQYLKENNTDQKIQQTGGQYLEALEEKKSGEDIGIGCAVIVAAVLFIMLLNVIVLSPGYLYMEMMNEQFSWMLLTCVTVIVYFVASVVGLTFCRIVHGKLVKPNTKQVAREVNALVISQSVACGLAVLSLLFASFGGSDDVGFWTSVTILWHNLEGLGWLSLFIVPLLILGSVILIDVYWEKMRIPKSERPVDEDGRPVDEDA